MLPRVLPYAGRRRRAIFASSTSPVLTQLDTSAAYVGKGGRSTGANGDRPISFISQDEEWETHQDADRARRIEETLAALENEPLSGAPAN